MRQSRWICCSSRPFVTCLTLSTNSTPCVPHSELLSSLACEQWTVKLMPCRRLFDKMNFRDVSCHVSTSTVTVPLSTGCSVVCNRQSSIYFVFIVEVVRDERMILYPQFDREERTVVSDRLMDRWKLFIPQQLLLSSQRVFVHRCIATGWIGRSLTQLMAKFKVMPSCKLWRTSLAADLYQSRTSGSFRGNIGVSAVAAMTANRRWS